jgi:hypothetical protein
MVEVPNAACAMQYTVVVAAVLRRTVGNASACCCPVVSVARIWLVLPSPPSVAEVVLMLPITPVTVVVPAGLKRTTAVTSQSPAVRDIDVTFVTVPLVSETVLAVPVMYSPTLPAVALLLVETPTILGVVIVGLMPNTAAPLPVSSDRTPASCAEVVAANCASVPLVSAYAVPHENPDALVYFRALFAVLQLGSATAVGDADAAVTFATTVLAACAASAVAVTFPHAGGVLVPVETTACPAVELDGFSSCTELSVAANTVDESASSAAQRIRFMVISQSSNDSVECQPSCFR